MLTVLPSSMSRMSRKCGILDVSQIYGSPRPVTGIAVLTTLRGHSLGTFCFSITFLNLSLFKMLQQLSGAIANSIFLYTSPSFLKISVPHWKKERHKNTLQALVFVLLGEKNTDFACSFVWIWNLVLYLKGRYLRTKCWREYLAGDWRKMHNEELRDLYSSSSIIRTIEARRIRWAGNVAWVGKKRNAYKALVGKLDGKRPQGISKRR
jgi:hypothetical protein